MLNTYCNDFSGVAKVGGDTGRRVASQGQTAKLINTQQIPEHAGG